MCVLILYCLLCYCIHELIYFIWINAIYYYASVEVAQSQLLLEEAQVIYLNQWGSTYCLFESALLDIMQVLKWPTLAITRGSTCAVFKIVLLTTHAKLNLLHHKWLAKLVKFEYPWQTQHKFTTGDSGEIYPRWNRKKNYSWWKLTSGKYLLLFKIPQYTKVKLCGWRELKALGFNPIHSATKWTILLNEVESTQCWWALQIKNFPLH